MADNVIVAKPINTKRPILRQEQLLKLAESYTNNPDGPVGIRYETNLRNICLHCGLDGIDGIRWPNDQEYWCFACSLIGLDNPEIKYHVWYVNHCSNYKCLEPVDSRDPEIHRCRCGGLICAECGSCKTTCPFS